MAYIHPAWEEYQRQRFTRPDGDRYLKPPPFDHRAFIEEYRAAKAAEAARSAPVTCSLDDPEVRRLVSVEDLLRIVMMPSSSAANSYSYCLDIRAQLVISRHIDSCQAFVISMVAKPGIITLFGPLPAVGVTFRHARLVRVVRLAPVLQAQEIEFDLSAALA